MAQMNGMESGISQIPRRMAEKRRKCGIIPPKVEWLACLHYLLVYTRPSTYIKRDQQKPQLQHQHRRRVCRWKRASACAVDAQQLYR